MYRMFRVFCATAWELEGERRAFYEVIGEFNESTAMARGVLYVPVSLTNVRDKRPYQYTIEENIRDCRHYIVALSDDWGPGERNFRKDYQLAVACQKDPALPMEGVAVLMQSSSHVPPALAAELEQSGVPVTLISDVTDFRTRLAGLLARWVDIDSQAAAPAGT
jgi:hypothetical protein